MELAIHTVSVDEMTGIQSLERIAATKLMQAGQVELREFEYKRHGTQCLIGNFEVATGQIIRPTVRLLFPPARVKIILIWKLIFIFLRVS